MLGLVNPKPNSNHNPKPNQSSMNHFTRSSRTPLQRTLQQKARLGLGLVLGLKKINSIHISVCLVGC